MRIFRHRHGFQVFVGPWASRIDWGPGRFGWLEGQGPIIRFVRRWWTGWHRWDDA